MNLAHIHIVLNHVPTLGSLVACGLLIWSRIRKNNQIEKASLTIMLVMTILALPTYLTGNAAQSMLASRADIPRPLIEAHQNAAILALIALTASGLFGWLGLWQLRRFSRLPSWNRSAVLVLSIAAAVLILRTANFGGKISYPEIRPETAVIEQPVWQTSVEAFVSDNSWVWPAAETLHFIGMTLVFGVALTVSLRMLGVMKRIPFSAMHRVLPLGILGFVVNLITGMVFFIAYPGLYVGNSGFTIKMIALLLAGFSVIYFTVFDDPWKVGPDQKAGLTPKVVAVATTGLVLVVMYFGRMIPFLA